MNATWKLVLTAGIAATLVPHVLAGGAGAEEDVRRVRLPQGQFTAVINGQEVPAPDLPMGDRDTIRSILEEGLYRNQVMDHLTHLTKQIGPRLTGSTNATRANEWCMQMYALWGLYNPHLEKWGDIPVGFDRGPSSGKLVLSREEKKDDGTSEVKFDTLRELNLSTLAWTAGTQGESRGIILKEPRDENDYKAAKDKLKGAWILMDPPAAIGQRGVRSRLSDSYEMRQNARKKVAEGAKVEDLTVLERLAFDDVAGYVSTTRDERVWTGAAPGWRTLDFDNIPKDVHIIVRGSDYDAINSRLYDGDPVQLAVNLEHTLNRGPIPVYNTVAEIRGTTLPDEVVIVSAHLDSWNGPGSEGCTDNGTGSAVTLEAARILKSVGAQPKRTIRFINWTGEEQGLLGSRGYCEMHAAELQNISAVFVDDGGTNYEGGLPAATEMIPMLAAATAPINNVFYSATDKKFLNVNIRDTGAKIETHGSSDHASFNQKGVPGFFWDEVGRSDYGYGWHTQHDKLDIAIPEYLQQSATCAAITAYNLACADSLLPRVKRDEAAEAAAEAARRERRQRREQQPQPAAQQPQAVPTK